MKDIGERPKNSAPAQTAAVRIFFRPRRHLPRRTTAHIFVEHTGNRCLVSKPFLGRPAPSGKAPRALIAVKHRRGDQTGELFALNVDVGLAIEHR